MIKKIILLLFIPLIANAATLPEPLAVPGGIVIKQLAPSHTEKPTAFFLDNRVLVVKDQEHWTAIVGIPLSLKPGVHQLLVTTSHRQNKKLPFTITAKNYPAQYITLKNTQMVSPNATNLARIKQERRPINRALNTWSEKDRIETDFSLPVVGRLSSLFGLRRFFNNQPKNPHSGLDIAAPKGTAITAPTTATVLETGHFYYNGKTVFLDHGQGLISGYFHMTDIHVKPGQRVYRGEILGTVGETGRVTGPHLHWNIYLNKAKVDPALFINSYLPQLTGEPIH
jgi:murein DD-endopeptidase MepM/ murein hydrolase activator NlpD